MQSVQLLPTREYERTGFPFLFDPQDYVGGLDTATDMLLRDAERLESDGEEFDEREFWENVAEFAAAEGLTLYGIPPSAVDEEQGDEENT